MIIAFLLHANRELYELCRIGEVGKFHAIKMPILLFHDALPLEGFEEASTER
jgi:hypothetical protein